MSRVLSISPKETRLSVPPLALPFPERRSPHCSYAERAVLRWACGTGLAADERTADRLASPAWGHCAAVSTPRTSRDRLSLMACWLAWLGVLDDTAETYRTRASFAEAVSGVRAVLATGRAQERHPLVVSFTDLHRRTGALGSPAWRGRYAEITAQLLDGLVDEQRVKQEACLPGVAEYVEYRRVTGYMPLLYAVTEIVLRCKVPSTIQNSGVYARLLTASIDAADFINDIPHPAQGTGARRDRESRDRPGP
ncbi:hypothetical protein [Streptomyces sp. NPDC059003]|uniref:terpene synthase family protein n=1 Tax=Streptomyces sp. NPDC059003 TaxID=3346691 RepID=UPI0036CCF99A